MNLVIHDRQPIFFANQGIGDGVTGNDLAALVECDNAHGLARKGRAIQSALFVHLNELHAICDGALNVRRQHFKKLPFLGAKILRRFGPAEPHAETLSVGIAQVDAHHVIDVDGLHAEMVQVSLLQRLIGDTFVQ